MATAEANFRNMVLSSRKSVTGGPCIRKLAGPTPILVFYANKPFSPATCAGGAREGGVKKTPLGTSARAERSTNTSLDLQRRPADVVDLDVIDGHHQAATVFHLNGNDLTLLHDVMARLLEGLLQLGRNDASEHSSSMSWSSVSRCRAEMRKVSGRPSRQLAVPA